MSRKKVLIITYYWPPSGGPGVQRWLKFSKYLRNFNWEPIIYTPENPEAPADDESLFNDIPENLQIIKKSIWEPYSFYKKFTRQKKEARVGTSFLAEGKKPKLAEKIAIWIRSNLFIPDARKYWIKPSIRFLTEYLKDHPVDVIVSTGPPHSMHLIALGIRQKTGIPWLADFRDPWTGIDFYNDLILTKRSDRKHHNLEKKILMTADRTVIVGESYRQTYQLISGKKIDLITNGYDEDDFLKTSIKPDTSFSLAHIGNMIKSRNPETLWRALSELIEEIPGFQEDLEIRLIGKVDISVHNALHRYRLDNNVKMIDYLPHSEVVRHQMNSQVLLLVLKQVINAQSMVPGKFFEYLAARRPVLCIGPPQGDIGNMMRDTKAGYIVDYEDLEGTKRIVLEYYEQFKKGLLKADSRNIERYSREILTGDLVKILNEMTVLAS